MPISKLSAVALAAVLVVVCDADAQAQAGDVDGAGQPQVVTVTGQVYRDLRPYSHYAPGLREFWQQRHLAPKADLRFGLVSGLSGKLLPLKHARLVRTALFSSDWSRNLPLPEDGWFTIPGPQNAAFMDADIEVSWRGKGTPSWVLDVHTPDLPYRVYRLGDLRLECRVYLAIEWELKRGKTLMGQPRAAVGTEAMGSQTPMDFFCAGPRAVFVNTQPWPKLEAYVISEGGRSVGHLFTPPLLHEAFQLVLEQKDGAPPWSDDALVEFVFLDKSRWQPVQAVEP